MFQNDLFAGKRILVTGGGSGLGAAMARRFAELGADLVLCGRRAEMPENVATEIRATSRHDVTTRPCDIRDAAATFIAQSEQMSARAATPAKDERRMRLYRIADARYLTGEGP